MRLVQETREAHQAMGIAGYERKPVEEASMKFRRSLYFVKDIKLGEIITEQHISRVRPGFGLAPKYYHQLLGKKAAENITRGTATTWELINND